MENKAFCKSIDDGAGRSIWEGKQIYTQNDYSSEKICLKKKEEKKMCSLSDGREILINPLGTV